MWSSVDVGPSVDGECCGVLGVLGVRCDPACVGFDWGVIVLPLRMCVRRLLSVALTRSHVDAVGGGSVVCGAVDAVLGGVVVVLVTVVGGAACSCSSQRCAHLCIMVARWKEFVCQCGVMSACILVG